MKGYRYNDAFLRPYMVSNCMYDYMIASKGTRTPFRYEVNYRNYFLVAEGSIKVKLSPPKSSKYLYQDKDYEISWKMKESDGSTVDAGSFVVQNRMDLNVCWDDDYCESVSGETDGWGEYCLEIEVDLVGGENNPMATDEVCRDLAQEPEPSEKIITMLGALCNQRLTIPWKVSMKTSRTVLKNTKQILPMTVLKCILYGRRNKEE